jgi:hypothetical protein
MTERSVSVTESFVTSVNGQFHLAGIGVFVTWVLAHWVEHIVQAYQVYVSGMLRHHSHGAVGGIMPWLITSEWLHFGYVAVTFVGLVLLRNGFTGTAKTWWSITVGIGLWHLIEHTILLAQATVGYNLFGFSEPASLLQLIVPRIELHLFYNAAMTLPLMIALFHHFAPSLRAQEA